jgi:hypothetical protein
MSTIHHDLASRVAAVYAARPEVRAVALGGSRGLAALETDAASDIDLYVYTHAPLDIALRRELAGFAGGGSHAEIGFDWWGPGDEWDDPSTGIHLDVIHFGAQWIEDQVDRVLRRHEPSLGYSTCLAFTVAQSILLAGDAAWYDALQQVSRGPYSDVLRQRIVAHNRAALRGTGASYANQLAKAALRRDIVSVNHRLAGFLASYFDILFALNRRLHPGEKRLVDHAIRDCRLLPEGMAADVAELLETAMTDLAGLGSRIERLVDRLDERLRAEGLAELVPDAAEPNAETC